MGNYGGWGRYVPVAERRATAEKKMKQLMKKGQKIEPISIEGRKIANTFWGAAWCSHLEKFSDYANRLPRGRTYVRNGSVCHLEIQKETITAMVSGSSLYNVNIKIKPLPQNKWNEIKKKCAGSIGSMLELLQGKLSSNIMKVVTDSETGLFPQPQEIELTCDCPDWATMCKHVAAVLYGVGARLDHSPELLFLLRNVNHEELIASDLELSTGTSRKRQVTGDLSALFDVELDEAATPKKTEKIKSSVAQKRTSPSVKKSTPAAEEQPVSISSSEITAASILNLRAKFAMTPSEFAKLIQVSPQTIKNWESKRGILNLQATKRTAIENVSTLTKEKANKHLRTLERNS
ncbi:SWIM zinc finger family protein [Deltaproteobacteria bacterium TL4]